MSDSTYTPDDDGDDNGQQTPDQLREAAKRGAKWKAEAEAVKRENAFLRAGIDPEDTRLKYFVKGYDGPLEADAIRSAAVEAKFIEPPQEPVDPAVQQAEQGQQRVMDATSGSAPENDMNAIRYGMEQAVNEGGIEGLSAYTQRYGITFNPEPVK